MTATFESRHGADGSPRPLTERFRPFVEANERRLEWALYAVTLVGGWLVRFSQDDAFISYRYARNLAQGHGLVFNPGERVEGYTNFLWTVIHVIPEKAGWSTPMFSQLLGLAVAVGTVAVVLRLSREIVGDRVLAMFATWWCVASLTFLAYATGGLETMLQSGLCALVGLCVLRGGAAGVGSERTKWFVAAGFVGGVALLTRLDSAVLVGSWFAVALWRIRDELRSEPSDAGRASAGLSRLVVPASTLGLPMAAVVLPWLVWKVGYYGSLVPNTFAAKSGASVWQPWVFGVLYLLLFLASYGAFMLIPGCRASIRSFLDLPAARPAMAVVLVWLTYIVYVGGDFMEFRFLVPVIPLLSTLLAFLVDRPRAPRRLPGLAARRWRPLVIGVLLFASLCHRLTPQLIPPVLAFNQIDNWPKAEATTWKGIGELLQKEFPGEVDAPGRPLVAVAPLGVIGYYSRLPMIDMVGLADEWVARNGDTFRFFVPGHVRFAPVAYLERRGVDLVVGEPLMIEPTPGRTSYRMSELIAMYPAADLRALPRSARAVEIPLDDRTVLVTIELRPSAMVDARVEANGWATFPIERVCDSADYTTFMRLAGSRSCPGL